MTNVIAMDFRAMRADADKAKREERKQRGRDVLHVPIDGPTGFMVRGAHDLITAKDRARQKAVSIGEAQIAMRTAIADLFLADPAGMLKFADASLMPFRDRTGSCSNE